MSLWNLRMNLDELNSLLAKCYCDTDRAQAFQGLVIGANGGAIPELEPEDTSEVSSKTLRKSLRAGFEVGSKWRVEAEQFREKQRLGGKRSAETRAATYGSAQPSSKSLRENPEDTSGASGESAEVSSRISRTNLQSTICTVSTSTSTPEEKTEKKTRKKREPKAPKTPEWAAPYPQPVLDATLEILSFWPTSGLQPTRKGEPEQEIPKSSAPALAERLNEAHTSGGDLDVCVSIARRFVEEWKAQRVWMKGAQYFFGKAADAPFRAYYRAEMTNRTMGGQHAG